MNILRVLFVCQHNSARSQMAEAYLAHLGGEKFFGESAGLEPGTRTPYDVDSLLEDRFDISGLTTDSVFNYVQEGRHDDIVNSICSPEDDKLCPIFPGKTLRLNRPFPDPSEIQGTGRRSSKVSDRSATP